MTRRPTGHHTGLTARLLVQKKSSAAYTMSVFEKEKRVGRFRSQCPSSLLTRLERALTQRMYLVDRSGHDFDAEGRMSETFKVLGSTGNIYTVLIGRVPSCDCPDHLRKSDVCKHLFFVYRRVLRLPASSALLFQRAFLQSELAEMLQDSRVESEADPTVLANQTVRDHYLAMSVKAKNGDGTTVVDAVGNSGVGSAEEARAAEEQLSLKQRRQVEEGDECPICFEGMYGAPESDLLWCDASRVRSRFISSSRSSSTSSSHFTGCGKALHADCARRWAAAVGSLASCPCCRAPWDTRPPSQRDNESSGVGHQNSDMRNTGMYVNLGSLQHSPSLSPQDGSTTFSPYGYGGYSRYVRRRFY